MCGDINYNPEDGEDFDTGNTEPTIPYLMKAGSESDANNVPILLWKPYQYNDFGHSKGDFIIGGVTIHVMTLSKTDIAYFQPHTVRCCTEILLSLSMM